jgi:hypothetical protein
LPSNSPALTIGPTAEPLFPAQESAMNSALVTGGLALLGAGGISRLWRRLGRERVSAGGATDAAFGSGIGERNRILSLVLGGIGLICGFGLVVVGAGQRNPSAMTWAMRIGGALLGGMALAALFRAWELRSRTVHGSSQWLRVASFRRFFTDSETQHAEQAIRLGRLREYTAWAVAFGESERWNRAMHSTSILPDPASSRYALLGPSIVSSTARASTQPQSSSSGGGGSFGGGGGGGGGSW